MMDLLRCGFRACYDVRQLICLSEGGRRRTGRRDGRRDRRRSNNIDTHPRSDMEKKRKNIANGTTGLGIGQYGGGGGRGWVGGGRIYRVDPFTV